MPAWGFRFFRGWQGFGLLWLQCHVEAFIDKPQIIEACRGVSSRFTLSSGFGAAAKRSDCNAQPVVRLGLDDRIIVEKPGN